MLLVAMESYHENDKFISIMEHIEIGEIGKCTCLYLVGNRMFIANECGLYLLGKWKLEI